MSTTYKLIESVTLSSAAASVTLGAGGTIPQTYTDLVVVVSARSSNGNMPAGSADTLKMALNSTAMSSVRYLYGSGTSSGSTTSPIALAHLTDQNTTANTFASVEILLPNYTGVTAKSVSSTAVTEHNGTVATMAAWAGLYSTVTSAVTQVQFTTTNAANFVAGSSFYLFGVSRVTAGVSATGGTVTTVDGYNIHTFTSSGSFVVSEPGTVEYLVVAGGGGGASGGGGAGGYESGVFTADATTYAVTVGAGGAGGTNIALGANGSASSVSAISCTGGGRGGVFSNSGTNAGSVGGSGGGGGGADGGRTIGVGGAGTAGEGHAGGNGTATNTVNTGGGGGGAGAVGGVGVSGSNGGAGGTGRSSLISGSAVTRGGGGSGGGSLQTAGGAGGGGFGGASSSPGGPGTANTGGGGGGGGNTTGGMAGGSGGSGVVIIRYPV